MVFSLFASYPGQKERILNFFMLFQYLLSQVRFTYLAHKENTQSDIFLWDRQKFLIQFVLLGLWYNIPSPMDEILTLWSPHKVLKNLGALSEYAKCSQSSTDILTLYPRYNGMVKKPSHAPVKYKQVYLASLAGQGQEGVDRVKVCVHEPLTKLHGPKIPSSLNECGHLHLLSGLWFHQHQYYYQYQKYC